MHLSLHKYGTSGDGDYPIIVLAEDIQVIEYSNRGTSITLIGGATIYNIVETPREILEWLQINVPKWG